MAEEKPEKLEKLVFEKSSVVSEPQVVALHQLLDKFMERFAETLSQQAQDRVEAALASALPKVGAFPTGIRRLCPVPGCGKLGAGPRNRWFCREHAAKLPVGQQKKLLQEARAKEREQRRAASLAMRERRSRPLDMSCRVEGCPNRSRGPRYGYICDDHRKQLNKKQQAEARDKWNEKHKAAQAAGNAPAAA